MQDKTVLFKAVGNSDCALVDEYVTLFCVAHNTGELALGGIGYGNISIITVFIVSYYLKGPFSVKTEVAVAFQHRTGIVVKGWVGRRIKRGGKMHGFGLQLVFEKENKGDNEKGYNQSGKEDIFVGNEGDRSV